MRMVKSKSHISIWDGAIIENNVHLGPNVVFTNAKFPLSPNVKNELAGPEIGEGAKIGANSNIYLLKNGLLPSSE